MTWFAWPGGIIDAGPPWTEELEATFMHGYATKAEAEAHPNLEITAMQSNIINQIEAAQALLGGPAGSGENSAAAKAASTAAKGVTSVTGFLTDLTNRNTWLRVVKVMVGMGLILAGIIHLSGAGKIAATATGTAVKGAVLA
jgi:hypothetical protein